MADSRSPIAELVRPELLHLGSSLKSRERQVLAGSGSTVSPTGVMLAIQ